jgi:hypothetical protein
MLAGAAVALGSSSALAFLTRTELRFEPGWEWLVTWTRVWWIGGIAGAAMGFVVLYVGIHRLRLPGWWHEIVLVPVVLAMVLLALLSAAPLLMLGKTSIRRLEPGAILLIQERSSSSSAELRVRDGGSWRLAAREEPDSPPPYAVRASSNTGRYAIVGAENVVGAIVDTRARTILAWRDLPPLEALRAEFGEDVLRPE